MHTQMLSFEDSAIRNAGFPVMSEKEADEMNGQEQIVAWIGVDWADEGHRVWEYNVGTGGKQNYAVKHSGESLQEWLIELRNRYGGNESPLCWNRRVEG